MSLLFTLTFFSFTVLSSDRNLLKKRLDTSTSTSSSSRSSSSSFSSSSISSKIELPFPPPIKFGSLTLEGQTGLFTVDYDKWCNTEILGNGIISEAQKNVCFTVATVVQAPPGPVGRSNFVSDDFIVRHYLPDWHPLGGDSCCGVGAFDERFAILFGPNKVQTDTSIFPTFIAGLSDKAAFVSQMLGGTVIKTGKRYHSKTIWKWSFNEEGLIYLAEIWSDDEIIKAFMED